MKKKAIVVISLYLLFGLMIYSYLFFIADTSIPEALKGTAVDPATFLTGSEYDVIEQFSKIRNILFFLSVPYEWIFYYFILLFGFSALMEKWSASITKVHFLQVAIYVFIFSVISFIILLPIRYLSYQISKHYEISTQIFASWMKDKLIDFWLEYLVMTVVVIVVYALMKKLKERWWLAVWGLFIPFTIITMFVQPVIVDPLYNDFYPLKDKVLEEKILALADEADIPAEHVYEVNMSDKTNSINAYVTGIGKNSRIVLWDTTLERLTEPEILFIMAHEIGHYVEKHIYIGMTGYILLALIGFWLISVIFKKWIYKNKELFNIKSHTSISSLPALLLITSILLFMISPATNAFSRYQETRADRFAIELTEDPAAGIEAFQHLSQAGLSQVNPPALVKIFRYGHPTMMERMLMLMDENGSLSNNIGEE